MHSTVAIRPLEPGDVDEVACLVALCSGRSAQRQADMLFGVLNRGPARGIVLVATEHHQIVGVGRIAYFEAPADAPENVVPNGWYLMGVDVHPDFRRRGVGSALTRKRLDWIFERAAKAWFFTCTTNEASLALHRAFEFKPVTTDFWFPSTDFHLGGGVLLSSERA